MRKVLALLVLFVITLAGCSSETSNQTFKRGTAEIENLDVTAITTTVSFDFFEAIVEGLYVIDGEGVIQPGVATELPTISSDGLEYTFKLRDDSKWVDYQGNVVASVTANDFVYAWQRKLDPKSGAGNAYIYDVIDGYNEARNGNLEALNVKAIDEKTLQVKLTQPTPYFTEMLAFNAFAPIYQQSVDTHGENYGTTVDTVLYNGPFYATTFDKTGTSTVIRNENYWDNQTTQLDQIDYIFMSDENTQFTAFNAGELDMAAIPGPEQYIQAETENKEAIVFRDTAGTMGLYFNSESEVSGNIHLRKAVQNAIDVEVIANDIFGAGTKAVHNFIPGSLTVGSYGVNFNDITGPLTEKNLELAKTEIALAKEQLGDDITVRLLLPPGDVIKLMGEYLQSYLKTNLSIDLVIEQFDQSTYADKRKVGNFDIIYTGWIGAYGDASNFLGVFQSQNIGGLNTIRLNSPDYDQAFKDANFSDSEQRNELFAKLETQLVKDDAYITPLISRGKSILVNPEYEFPTNPVFKVSSKYIKINE